MDIAQLYLTFKQGLVFRITYLAWGKNGGFESRLHAQNPVDVAM